MKSKLDLFNYLYDTTNVVSMNIRQHILRCVPNWGYDDDQGFAIKVETLKFVPTNAISQHILSEPL